MGVYILSPSFSCKYMKLIVTHAECYSKYIQGPFDVTAAASMKHYWNSFLFFFLLYKASYTVVIGSEISHRTLIHKDDTFQ